MQIEGLKNRMGLQDTTDYDTFLETWLPDFIEDAATETNQDFEDMPYDDLPAGVKIYIAKALEFNINETGVKSKKTGTLDVQFATDLPGWIPAKLNPHRRLNWRGR